MNGTLPNSLRYQTSNDLVRLGRDGDGGYLVSRSSIEASDALVGLGINDDWSFESDFLKYKKVPVYAYDGSISARVFLKKFLKSTVKFYRPKVAFHWLQTLMGYRNFFTDNRIHIQKFVGLNAKGKHCTLNEVLDGIDEQNLFLKVDIEGSEYRILDELIENSERLTGLVIEFHDCDVHMKSIETFVENFGLPLVHIHANNFAPIRLDDLLPTVLEFTFSKNSGVLESALLPHKLDKPNNKRAQEINLTFRDDPCSH